MEKEICVIKKLQKKITVGEYEQDILKGLDFTINEHEFVVVLGPSGAGKSTLLNILGGLDKASAGEVVCDKVKLSKATNKELNMYRQKIGFVFQEYALIENLTVYENIAMMNVITKKKGQVTDILRMVGLEKHADKFPGQLSCGEKQRVAIARALVKKPDILFCDEPTGALDEANGKNILKILQDLNTKGTTIVVVTHLLGMAKMANHVLRIVDGKIKEDILNENVISAEEVSWS